jgi:hypothetical protein
MIVERERREKMAFEESMRSEYLRRLDEQLSEIDSILSIISNKDSDPEYKRKKDLYESIITRLDKTILEMRRKYRTESAYYNEVKLDLINRISEIFSGYSDARKVKQRTWCLNHLLYKGVLDKINNKLREMYSCISNLEQLLTGYQNLSDDNYYVNLTVMYNRQIELINKCKTKHITTEKFESLMQFRIIEPSWVFNEDPQIRSVNEFVRADIDGDIQTIIAEARGKSVRISFVGRLRGFLPFI